MSKKYISAFFWAWAKLWRLKKSAIAFWALLHLTGAPLPVFLYPLIGRVVDAVSAGLSAGELGNGIYGLLLLLCGLLLLRSVYGVLPDVARFARMAQATIPVQNEFMRFTEEIPLHYFNDAAFANEVIDGLENGYGTNIGALKKGMANLSGGQ